MSSSSTIENIITALTRLDGEDINKVLIYTNSLVEVDHDNLDAKEADAIENLGYTPTTHIDSWEWEAMLKRDLLAEEKRVRKLNNNK